MKKNLWELDLPKFSSLDTDSCCDICIVGGGLTGISLAYYLKDTPSKVILIEQNHLGCSTTLRSTAKLTYLQQDLLSKIQYSRGKNAAFKYYQAQRDAMNEVIRIIKKENIDCYLEKCPSYLFVQEKKNLSKLKKEFDLYKSFGAPIRWKDRLPMNCEEVACCFVEDTYVFHPLAYLKGLITAIQESKKEVQIYEQTRMINYQKKKDFYTINLENGHAIQAKKLVFAGHYPPFVIPYLFPIKVYLEKEFVAIKPSQNFHFNAINLDSDIFSIRFFKEHCIHVFHSKQLGNSSILEFPTPNQDEKFQYEWSNYDIMTSHSLPIIGWIGSSKNGLYLGTGFNAWGMTNSNLAAQVLSFELQGKHHSYSKLFSPSACSIPAFVQTFMNVFSNIYHFIASYLPNKTSARIVWRNGHRVGIVKDSKGIQHEVSLTCPHLGCGIRYNPKDETWDCPCHGSRFDLDGHLLRGPATDCISENKD